MPASGIDVWMDGGRGAAAAAFSKFHQTINAIRRARACADPDDRLRLYAAPLGRPHAWHILITAHRIGLLTAAHRAGEDLVVRIGSSARFLDQLEPQLAAA